MFRGSSSKKVTSPATSSSGVSGGADAKLWSVSDVVSWVVSLKAYFGAKTADIARAFEKNVGASNYLFELNLPFWDWDCLFGIVEVAFFVRSEDLFGRNKDARTSQNPKKEK